MWSVVDVIFFAKHGQKEVQFFTQTKCIILCLVIGPMVLVAVEGSGSREAVW